MPGMSSMPATEPNPKGSLMTDLGAQLHATADLLAALLIGEPDDRPTVFPLPDGGFRQIPSRAR
jgi:hypothetical protein